MRNSWSEMRKNSSAGEQRARARESSEVYRARPPLVGAREAASMATRLVP
jgi:hypothetical protein